MQKIPIETLISFISQTEEESSKDPELDLDLSEFLLVFPGSGAYDWRITPNPETVEFGYADLERLGRLDLDRLNTMARRARERRFRARLAAGDKSPVIVTEGDSWFQFPFFRKRVADLVDHLETDYLTWCVSAAGDTAWDMTHTRGRFEYMKALIAAQKNPKTRPQAFLMSMGGNEFIGSIDGILKSQAGFELTQSG